MSSGGGLPPKKVPPNVTQTRSSRLLARRQLPTSTTYSTSLQPASLSQVSPFPNSHNRVTTASRRSSNTSLADGGNTSRHIGNRLSLPSINQASASGLPQVLPNRWRTNASQDYFNELGMVLDSGEDSPIEISEWDYRSTPRATNNNSNTNSVTGPRSNRLSARANESTRSSSLFPISRNSLLSSRSNNPRPVQGEANTSNNTEPVDTVRNNENSSAFGMRSSEFSQVLQELSQPASSSETNSTPVATSSTVQTTTTPSISTTAQASATRAQRSTSLVNTTGASFANRQSVSRDDHNDLEVESVDEVLARIRRQNNLQEPSSTHQNTSRQNTVTRVSSNSNQVSRNVTSTSQSNNVNVTATTSSRTPSSTASVSRSSEPVAAAATTAISTGPVSVTSTAVTPASSATTVTTSSNAPSRLTMTTTVQPSSSSRQTNHANIESTSAASQNSQVVAAGGSRNTTNGRTSIVDRYPSRRIEANESGSSSSRLDRDELTSILATPTNSNSNEIFDSPEENTNRNIPPIRNSNTATLSTARDFSPPSEDELYSDTTTFVIPRRNRTRIGVRFTRTLGQFSGGMRASEDTNTIFSSDDSEDDYTVTPDNGPMGTVTPQENIPHIDAQLGIMQLLGLDLPQSTTEVILLNQRSILEQLLETYISLMVSLQSAESQRPVGLSEDAINKLPREMIIKQQVTDNLTCSICLANFEFEESATKLPDCTHLFHHPCITHWLQKSPTCPMCRTPVHND